MVWPGIYFWVVVLLAILYIYINISICVELTGPPTRITTKFESYIEEVKKYIIKSIKGNIISNPEHINLEVCQRRFLCLEILHGMGEANAIANRVLPRMTQQDSRVEHVQRNWPTCL